MKKKDTLYVIFMGLVLFLSGAIILGGIRYLISLANFIDFVTVILYFFFAIYITKLVMKKVTTRSRVYSIILPLYTAIMYVLKDYVAFFVIDTLNGIGFKDVFLLFISSLKVEFLSYFAFPTSLSGIFLYIVGILYFIIEVLIMVAGVYQSYRITKQ